MGQKVNPNGFRVGVIRDWNTRWYANKKDFANFLVEDKKIRDYLKNKYFEAGIAKIDDYAVAFNLLGIGKLFEIGRAHV